MPISDTHAKRIQNITIDLGEVIHKISPVTEKEWAVFEQLTRAHAILRKTNVDDLVQLELPMSVR